MYRDVQQDSASEYAKCPKIWNTLYRIYLARILLSILLLLKILSRMENSEDFDEEQSDLGLQCLPMPLC